MLSSRHERFAVGIAQGLPQGQAYASAGYRTNDPAASRLARNVKVRARIRELQAEATVQAVKAVAISKAAVLAELAKLAFAEIGDANVPVNVKRMALCDIAKIAGYVVEKRETGTVGAFEEKSDDELRAIVAGQLSPLGRRPAGVRSVPGQ